MFSSAVRVASSMRRRWASSSICMARPRLSGEGDEGGGENEQESGGKENQLGATKGNQSRTPLCSF